VGINYLPQGGEVEVRREPGESVDDLPEAALETQLELGFIAEVKE
jgi:hypothetical protein